VLPWGQILEQVGSARTPCPWVARHHFAGRDENGIPAGRQAFTEADSSPSRRIAEWIAADSKRKLCTGYQNRAIRPVDMKQRHVHKSFAEGRKMSSCWSAAKWWAS